MTTIVTKFEIPAGRPIPTDQRGSLGPSAELIDFEPKQLCSADVVGRRVDKIVPYAGTYGMGGPGFFGFKIGEDWLIIALWGAADWLQVDGRRVGDGFYETDGSPKPWISKEEDELSSQLVGRVIMSVEIARTSMKIIFDNKMVLSIEEDSRLRPTLAGSRRPRAFEPDDDLRKAVFLSPTAELWV